MALVQTRLWSYKFTCFSIPCILIYYPKIKKFIGYVNVPVMHLLYRRILQSKDYDIIWQLKLVKYVGCGIPGYSDNTTDWMFGTVSDTSRSKTIDLAQTICCALIGYQNETKEKPKPDEKINLIPKDYTDVHITNHDDGVFLYYLMLFELNNKTQNFMAFVKISNITTIAEFIDGQLLKHPDFKTVVYRGFGIPISSLLDDTKDSYWVGINLQNHNGVDLRKEFCNNLVKYEQSKMICN